MRLSWKATSNGLAHVQDMVYHEPVTRRLYCDLGTCTLCHEPTLCCVDHEQSSVRVSCNLCGTDYLNTKAVLNAQSLCKKAI